MPITDEIVTIGPTGNTMCYILGTIFKDREGDIGTAKHIDEVIDKYLAEAKLNHYPGEGMTKEELKEQGWVTSFCVEDGRFWAYDASEC